MWVGVKTYLRYISFWVLYLALSAKAAEPELEIHWVLSTINHDSRHQDSQIIDLMHDQDTLVETDYGAKLVRDIDAHAVELKDVAIPNKISKIRIKVFYFDNSRRWAAGYQLLDKRGGELKIGKIDIESSHSTSIHCAAMMGKNAKGTCLSLQIIPIKTTGSSK